MNPRITAGTSCITWDDTWQRIVVNEHTLRLSPTQYRLCRAFLSTSNKKNDLVTGEVVILSYCSCEQLQEEVTLSHPMLIKYVSTLNTRLAASGLQVCSFQSGYLLIYSFNPPATKASETRTGLIMEDQ